MNEKCTRTNKTVFLSKNVSRYYYLLYQLWQHCRDNAIGFYALHVCVIPGARKQFLHNNVILMLTPMGDLHKTTRYVNCLCICNDDNVGILVVLQANEMLFGILVLLTTRILSNSVSV